ncbi:hypothetical protein EDC30_105163 [Paucimonas lemoignei]|uniref:Uncharacterized protein n=1 Tax=Paucimonas lemoignei TaxID=29443 RepID=A0A4R3HXE0_PAULE|nr:hypothetical protein [Paucimonas lemoignei]TCS36941.1 hypothetical protein EDC30_105163 [Paucimonas lemoignei]
MSPRYFKAGILIDTCCEHCGARHKETFARLYSDAKLICASCGQEHTKDRSRFRQNVDETESLVDDMSGWADTVAVKVRNWWKGMQAG